MNRFCYFVMACSMLLVLFSDTAHVQAQTFQDVSEEAYYYEAVEQLVELGILTRAKNFNADQHLTRGQMAKIMALALKLDTKQVKNPRFKDVPTSHQFYPYIAALENAGIVKGYSDGTYGVSKNVTHGQMAKFLVNGFHLKESEPLYFYVEDLEPNTEVYKNVMTLAFYEIAAVFLTYEPNKPITRLDASLMVATALNKQALKEIRIPLAKLGIQLLPADEETRIFLDLQEELLYSRVDVKNNELVLYPLQAGKTGLTFFDEELLMIQFDIDGALNVTYEIKEAFDSPYKKKQALYIVEEGDLIRSASFEQLTGNKKQGELTGYRLNDDGYMYIYMTAAEPNELFKITVHYMSGVSKQVYAKSEEDIDTIYLKQLNEGTARAAKIEETSGTFLYKLSEGNQEFVNIVEKWSDVYKRDVTDFIEITQAGVYLFNVTDTDDYVFEVHIEVIEIEGKKFHYQTYS